jgi:hypothetical protein
MIGAGCVMPHENEKATLEVLASSASMLSPATNYVAQQLKFAPVGKDQEPILSDRAVLMLTGAVWLYISFTDILYAEAMRIALAKVTSATVFFPWPRRLVQHVLMFPVLVACYLAANRMGWTPLRRRVPQQVAIGLSFALLKFWLMGVGNLILQHVFGGDPVSVGVYSKGDFAEWVSSTATGLLAYAFGLMLMTGVAAYRRYYWVQLHNSELKRDWASARLAALRTQLSPHTLFNVLHTIQAQITLEPQIAQSLVASLGDLLRGLLEAGERDFSLLGDELKFAELYLGLQVGRFADRLTVQVQDSQEAPRVWVPSLILQPLVENAVLHGLTNHKEPVRVDVGYELSGVLRLRVVNSTGASNTPTIGGIGLRNVRERLAVQFGDRGVLTSGLVDSTTWVATVTIPVLREWDSGKQRPEGAQH